MLEFLRDVGKHFTVNQMMAKDSVRSRIESEHGISYTEFSYMLLQANDFRHLYEHHGVELQAGASDQWGNIVAGVELIRRRLGEQAFAMTHPLMLKSDGTKFGKSVGGLGVARPGTHRRRTSSASSGCRPTTRWSRTYLQDAVAAAARRAGGAARRARGGTRAASRAARAGRRADHAGARRAPRRHRGRRRRRAVRWRSDDRRSPSVLAVVAAEVPSVELPADARRIARPRAARSAAASPSRSAT